MLDTRHLRIILLITALALVFIILLTVIIDNSRKHISQKPAEPDSSDIQPDSEEEEVHWYIKFSVENQRATAYVEEAYAPVAANGQDYFIGGAAMHPLYPVNYGGSPLEPIIPFGTTLYLSEAIEVQGREYTSVQVMDTGDIYYGLWPESPYWLDIYFGTANYYNHLDARAFGTDEVSYYWFEEWR